MFKYNFSVIVIVNDVQMKKSVQKSIAAQNNVDVELNIIDNFDNRYSGAREAFNSTKNYLNGEYILFMHQDIVFIKNDTLYQVLKQLNEIKNFGVVGVAGALKSGTSRIIFSNIFHGMKKIRVGENIEKATLVETVDECFFIIKNIIFRAKPFSEKNGWHLYSAEQSLIYGKDNQLTYVIPIDLWHLSDGSSLDCEYISTLKLIAKENPELRYLSTTVRFWNLGKFSKVTYLNYYYMKQFIKKKLKG